jgi:hypothetical protein
MLTIRPCCATNNVYLWCVCNPLGGVVQWRLQWRDAKSTNEDSNGTDWGGSRGDCDENGRKDREKGVE